MHFTPWRRLIKSLVGHFQSGSVQRRQRPQRLALEILEDRLTPTNVALSSSAATAVYGQAITLTATVSDPLPGLPTPTGTVDFYDQTTVTDLGVVPLTAGTATLHTPNLAMGNHVILASYGGDANSLPGTTTLSQLVNPTPVYWSNPSGGDWDTVANWQDAQGNPLGRLPGPTDAVVIDLPGQNGFTVTHDAGNADTVYSLTSKDCLAIDVGSLSLTSSSTIDALYLYANASLFTDGNLTVTGPDTVKLPVAVADYMTAYGPHGSATAYGLVLIGGTVGGSGTVYVETSSFLSWLPVTLDTALVNEGQAVMANGTFTINTGASLTNAAGASLQLEMGATFVGMGTLLNEATAKILAVATPLSQNDVYIQMPLVNAGLLQVEQAPLTIDGGSMNTGTYLVDSGGTLTIGSGSPSGTFLVDGGGKLAFQGTQMFTGGGSSIDGDGTGLVKFEGTASVQGNYSFGGTNIQVDGSLALDALDGPETLSGNLTLTPGSLLTTDGSLLVNGLFTTTGSILSGGGSLTMQGGASLHGDVQHHASILQNGFTLINPAPLATQNPAPSVTLTGTFTLYDGCTFDNNGLDSGV